MVRIAIAGAGGFAYILAQELSQSANPLLILSTRVSVKFGTCEKELSDLLTYTP